ncbi:MAG: hypothetical protein LBQ41_03335 [Candidatus Ancillula sp.]|jgi:hypothetical protein|nr:hypothetical protein [Candidatus Ancillula sp.]
MAKREPRGGIGTNQYAVKGVSKRKSRIRVKVKFVEVKSSLSPYKI